MGDEDALTRSREAQEWEATTACMACGAVHMDFCGCSSADMRLRQVVIAPGIYRDEAAALAVPASISIS